MHKLANDVHLGGTVNTEKDWDSLDKREDGNNHVKHKK